MSDCFSPIDPSPTLHDGKEPISCPGKTVFIVLLGAILCCLIRYQPMPFARVREPFDHPEWLFELSTTASASSRSSPVTAETPVARDGPLPF
jgi:hypothetical protein